MARVCDMCGKGARVGNQVTIRGKAKYLGGVGTKITGITRRTFKPNLQRVHITQNGTNKTVMACTQCIRSGVIVKTVKAIPFRLPNADAAKKAEKPAAPKKEAVAKKPMVKKDPAAKIETPAKKK